MEKLLEALKVLLGHTNRDEVVAAVEKEGAPIFQAIFQRGHDIGYGKKHGELERATARVTELEGRISTTEAELGKLKANPDTAALHKQYGDQITALSTTAKQREEELLRQVRDTRHSVRLGDLRGLLLGGEKRLMGDYVDVLLQKEEVRKRVKVGDDGTWQILQEGKDIPVAAQTPEAALALLADELKGKAPPTFVLVGTDVGGGLPGSRAPGAPATSGGADLAKNIRESVKAAATPATEAPKHHGAFAALSAQ